MFFHVVNKNNIIIFALLLGVAILFLSFNNSQLGIIHYADKHCQKNTACLIDVSRITPFDWDKMYIIDKGMRREDIENIIGAAFNKKASLFYKIIFVRNKKVVYSDEYHPSDDAHGKKFIKPDFYYPHDKEGNYFSHYAISKDNSILSVKIENEPLLSDKVYYKISPSNAQQVRGKNL
ncbi:hypothetical protein HZS38_15915 [Xenorhabdus nematophila]|uniref:Uncharacterized protein n=2 Tax=Xenorhabdus nematophila TaxID=628 RepID=D3VF47_XENNA|nr:hypothetical protein D3790_16430 [Xenorhabdus nematophila]CBJ92504.1 conserved hypothetical protein; putative exported protein [Xenorhabdus nematophila ATCC 19061]CCW31343.1 conserved exported hypothetical protein [Xenorhabdus nematophila F1]CEE90968.1 conserved hypothetical protein; putative exported protein [Xenorhabdus nematophila str. Anatoliense]CEF29138.1 conserved hypothetical protein; putative exported protein [Xenorhabdus nematophila str. Websteri]CEK25318.1 conserved hypothetical 